jgi:hypothetical protein
MKCYKQQLHNEITCTFGLEYAFWGFFNGVDGSSCNSWHFFSSRKVSHEPC